ncbi:MAG TPA: hypothetical protein VGF86_07150 [Candidatus Tumulicola sp.]
MDSAAAREIGRALETVLLAPILRPLATQPFGEFGSDALAREIADADSGGFAALVAATLEREP